MELLFYIGIIIASSLVVWKGSGLLESSSEALAFHYNLPPIIQGGIITAVGSSFPELSTTVVSTLLHGKFDLGVSAIIGSAIFNILVIPGVSVIVAGKLKSDRTLVYKDAQFYITSIAVLLLAFSIAVIYNPVEGSNLQGMVTRPIALIPFILYFLYLFLQQQELRDFKKEDEYTKNKPIDKIWKQWVILIWSLLLILVSVEGLVRSAIFMGDYFNTPSFIWGVTVVAAATSIPDALVSYRLAMNKKGVISLANVLGSNIFDLLICVPAGVLLAGSSMVDFSVAVPMMLYLTIVTIVLFTFMRTGLTIIRREGYILITLYLIFVLWMILESYGIMSYLVHK